MNIQRGIVLVSGRSTVTQTSVRNATQALGSTHLLQSWWCLHCTWPTADCAHCQCFSKPVKRSLISVKPPKQVSITRRNSLHLQQRQSWPARPLCREACHLWQVLCLSMPAAEETPLPPKQSVSWQSNINFCIMCWVSSTTHDFSDQLSHGCIRGIKQHALLCDLLHVGADICGKLQSSAVVLCWKSMPVQHTLPSGAARPLQHQTRLFWLHHKMPQTLPGSLTSLSCSACITADLSLLASVCLLLIRKERLHSCEFSWYLFWLLSQLAP